MLEDLDIDGKKDLILGEWYSSVRFYTNVGTNNDPVFENFIYLVDPDSQQFLNGNPPRVNFTDWDGDNDLDMITACIQASSIRPVMAIKIAIFTRT